MKIIRELKTTKEKNDFFWENVGKSQVRLHLKENEIKQEGGIFGKLSKLHDVFTPEDSFNNAITLSSKEICFDTVGSGIRPTAFVIDKKGKTEKKTVDYGFWDQGIECLFCALKSGKIDGKIKLGGGYNKDMTTSDFGTLSITGPSNEWDESKPNVDKMDWLSSIGSHPSDMNVLKTMEYILKHEGKIDSEDKVIKIEWEGTNFFNGKNAIDDLVEPLKCLFPENIEKKECSEIMTRSDASVIISRAIKELSTFKEKGFKVED